MADEYGLVIELFFIFIYYLHPVDKILAFRRREFRNIYFASKIFEL